MRSRSARLVGSLRWPAIFLPAPLFAHTTFKAAGELVNGAVHPFTVPAHVILLLVIGLFLAQPRPLQLKLTAPAFVGGAILGLIGSVGLPPSASWPIVLCVLTLVLALGVVLAAPLPIFLRAALAGLAAGVIGYDSPPGFDGWFANTKALIGTGLALVIFALDLAFYISLRPEQPWADIGVRVVSAWIAAVSIMLLAFQLRG